MQLIKDSISSVIQRRSGHISFHVTEEEGRAFIADIIEVSGTAAIDEHGISLYPGDIHAQIDCTFDKVQTLLAQEGAELKDICSATVFVKQPEFAKIFYEMSAARGLENFPCVCIVADVCREELLFEMDAEAVVKKGVKESGSRGFE